MAVPTENEEELIAKKDVLALTGISYGQLYRWKRKGLIPEAWFVRRSTFTGQETFFPKDKILSRIELIRSLKEEQSLDDLVRVLAPETRPETVRHDRPTALPPIGSEGHRLLWKDGGYTFAELVALACGAQVLRAGNRLAEAKLVLDLVRSEEALLRDPTGVAVILAEKSIDGEGVSVRFSFALLGREPLRLDREARVKGRLDLERLVEQVKAALREE